MTTLPNLNLFQIAQEYAVLAAQLMDTDADDQTIKDTLESIVWPLEVKAQNTAYVIRNLEASAAAIESAMQEMNTRKERMEKHAERLRLALKDAMTIAGKTELSCPHFAMAIKKNPPAVDIVDPVLVPGRFWHRKPPEPDPLPTINKKAIAAAFKAKQEVPGARQTQATRLEIK